MQPYGGEAGSPTADGKAGETTSIDEDLGLYKGATANDQNDMRRLSKKQELRVRRKIWQIMSRITDPARTLREIFDSSPYSATHCFWAMDGFSQLLVC